MCCVTPLNNKLLISLLFSRLKSIEILSNFLSSVIVLSPDDLVSCVYLCLNKLAPAYEGVELGLGENLLMKVISQATGSDNLLIQYINSVKLFKI